MALTVVIFIAVLAHKGSASFALGLELGRSEFSKRSAWRLFQVFVVMFPLGVLVGQALSTASDAHPWLRHRSVQPQQERFCFSALCMDSPLRR